MHLMSVLEAISVCCKACNGDNAMKCNWKQINLTWLYNMERSSSCGIDLHQLHVIFF